MAFLAFLQAHQRPLIQAGILLGAGLAVGLLVLPPAPKVPDLKAPPPEVLFLGERLEVASPMASEKALEVARKYVAGEMMLKMPGGASREVSMALLGAEIDRVRLGQMLQQVRDPTSAMRRGHQGKRGALMLPSPVVVNAPRALSTLLKLKEELDRQPVDARLDLTSRKLVPEQPGFRVDVYGTLARVDDAFRRGLREVEVMVEVVAPTVSAAGLGNVTFDEILGYFETRYSTVGKYEARSYNLRLAASRLDGYVLPPGAVFDFNKVVGPRNEANGYKVAPVIAQGELVDGIGGGTCQITGTLHGAVFFAGLDVVSRTPHTRPSGYIKMGLDAAVAYPTINFRFRNNFPFPIVLHETVKDGVVRAEVLGPKRTHTVTFIRKIEDVIPYQEVEKPDPKLPEGKRVLSQRGVPGFKLRRYRIIREGAFALREQWNDTYPPTTQIIRVGTGTNLPADTPIPEDDPHPEYTADEFLMVSQGPGVSSSRSGKDMIESREAGRTGQAGWTEKAGMKIWNPEHRGESRGEDEGQGEEPRNKKDRDEPEDRKKKDRGESVDGQGEHTKKSASDQDKKKRRPKR
ncbi:MAG: VanW family protein [Myxococcales bacterium]|nr:VanW family protein [Polyangiaceae bacterium]MDW8250992.1 VanW family protein [Myxococcales bacterium]